ncbi:serine hydrolase domain-containing protein [Microbacterium aquimaris]|uniref:serine hydrolase domain-containing protein n=1 Tax=Microbacterium aquimaris TaxID=459816 RepID=UPI002AD4F23E|nr:serine hydrolase domain-containing protein [Microbacterium aquimaris]MDZ8275277.1 serine hydrolase domain-containing protein [Microbacterium aquimaris]
MMRRRILGISAMAVAVALTASACSGGGTVEIDVPAQVEGGFPDELQQHLQEAAEHAMAATGATGAIVGVWAPWSGSWVTGIGTTGPDGAAVADDMTFRASRMTRAMTCDVLYRLDEKGTVSIDDSVADYVPGVPDLQDVTLGMLCDGTSGIGSYEPYLKADWIDFPGREWDPAFLASFGLGDQSDAEPGSAFRDSDAGYVLLGQAMENATRMSASDLIAEYVTEPLELTSTELPDPAPAEPGANPLPGYQSLRGEDGLNCAEPTDFTEASSSIGFTDSGVTSSIDDLGRYAQALATGALLAEESERFDGALPAYGDAPSWQTTAGGARITGSLIGQFGTTLGYSTAAFSDPDTGLTVALVLNNSAGGAAIPGYLAWELAAIASKAPAAAGQEVPDAGLPWTAEQFHTGIAERAVCPLPDDEG